MNPKILKTVKLTLVKSTKGTHVYGNEKAGLSGLYFPKAWFDEDPPQDIEVEVRIPGGAQ